MKHGDTFKAIFKDTIYDDIEVEGKISLFVPDIDNNFKEQFILLCQNKIEGGTPRFYKADRFGYKYIYVLTKKEVDDLNKGEEHFRVKVINISNRKSRIENLNI